MFLSLLGAAKGVLMHAAASTQPLGVTRRHDARPFHHQDHSSLGRSRSVHHSLRDDEPLSRSQFHCAALQVNDESPFHYVEELILIVVLVPVIFTLNDAESDDRVVHPAERLVVPAVGAGRDQSRH